jgi:hypothetical protein
MYVELEIERGQLEAVSEPGPGWLVRVRRCSLDKCTCFIEGSLSGEDLANDRQQFKARRIVLVQEIRRSG